MSLLPILKEDKTLPTISKPGPVAKTFATGQFVGPVFQCSG